jgi:hypothetical protein
MKNPDKSQKIEILFTHPAFNSEQSIRRNNNTTTPNNDKPRSPLPKKHT